MQTIAYLQHAELRYFIQLFVYNLCTWSLWFITRTVKFPLIYT